MDIMKMQRKYLIAIIVLVVLGALSLVGFAMGLMNKAVEGFSSQPSVRARQLRARQAFTQKKIREHERRV